MRTVEASELIAADLFRRADEDRLRITYGDVQKYLAQLAAHDPHACTCGRCGLVPLANAQRIFYICSGWQRQMRATRGPRRVCQPDGFATAPVWCQVPTTLDAEHLERSAALDQGHGARSS